MQNKNLYKIIVSLVIFSGLSAFSLAETIILKTGEKVDGTVIEKNEKHVKFDYKGAVIIYRTREIDKIDGKPVAVDANSESKKPLKSLLESGGASDAVRASDRVSPEEYMGRGIAYYGKANLDLALADFTRAIEAKHDYATAYLYRGLVYVSKNMLEPALADYNKAIELDPANEEAYYVRGMIYSGNREIDKAVSDFDKAIELNPKYIQAYLNRGLINITRGRNDEVLADVNKVIGINPDIATAYLLRGLVYVTRNNMDQAISDYTKAIELKRDYQEAYVNRALAYGYRDKIERSKVSPTSPNAYVDSSAPAINKEDFNRAISDCNKAIELDPNYVEAYGVRAKIYLLANEVEKARKDADKVEQLGGELKAEFLEDLKKASANGQSK